MGKRYICDSGLIFFVIMSYKKLLAICFISICISFILYGKTVSGGFVYDDLYFTHREELRRPESLLTVWKEPFIPRNTLVGIYRPFSVFTFALQFQLFGESPVSFRLVNIVINGLNGFLVFCVMWLLWRNQFIAISTGLFFLFFPIHSEVVGLIKSRDDLLASFFGLLSWIGILHFSNKSKYLMFVYISFLFSVLSKDTYMVLPVLYWFVWILQNRKQSILSWWGRGAPYLLVGGIYLLIRYLVLGENAFGMDNEYFTTNPLPFVDTKTRIFTAFKILFLYIGKTFFPILYFRLSATHYFNQIPLVTNPWVSIPFYGGVACFLLLVFCIYWKKTRQTFGIGATIFLVPYSIVSKIIFPHGDFIAERWMYFPSIGFALMTAWVTYWLYQKRKFLTYVIIAVCLVWYTITIEDRTTVWLSNRALYASMIADAPQSLQGYFGMASLEVEEGNIQQARMYAEKARLIYANHAPLLNVIGVIYMKEGRFQRAEESFKQAMAVDPSLASSYINLSKLYYVNKQYPQTLELVASIVKKTPNPRAEDVALYALTYVRLGKASEAIEVLGKYAHLLNTYSEIRYVYALAYFKLGKIDDAKRYFDWDKTINEKDKIKLLEAF